MICKIVRTQKLMWRNIMKSIKSPQKLMWRNIMKSIKSQKASVLYYSIDE
jgi:hypothetical protein